MALGESFSRRSKSSRALPEVADRSLSSYHSETVWPCCSAHALIAARWLSTPTASPVRSCEMRTYAPSSIAFIVDVLTAHRRNVCPLPGDGLADGQAGADPDHRPRLHHPDRCRAR